jgi:hypothetical protein
VGKAASPATVRTREADARASLRYVATFARQTLAACRRGQIGCAASDQEYYLSEWSRRGFDLAASWSNVGVVGFAAVLARETDRHRVAIAVPLSGTVALVATVRGHGPIKIEQRRCDCIDP